MKRSYSVVFAVLLLILTSFPALAQEPIVGEIIIWPASDLPDGWILCNGAQLNSTDYPALYGVLGTTYGSVPGFPGWFLVPNLRERVPVGRHSGVAQFDTLGETGGTISHTLTLSEMPSHYHGAFNYGGPGYNWTISSGGNNLASLSSGNTGGGQPHPNLQPYIVLNYIIYTGVLSATPTPTPTPTQTPTPTATPTGSVTPTATTTSTLYLPYVITTTLQSGTILSVPEQVSFGQIITSGIVLSLLAVVALDFLFRLVYRR